MAQSFEDTIRQIVKARLNPDTEALMKKKNEADAAYFGDPMAYNDTIAAGVYNPADRRALLDSHRQSLMSNSNTYNDALTNRDTSIDKVVTSFAGARKEQMDADAAQADIEFKRAQLVIDQQNANTSGRSADKPADPTNFDLLAQQVGKDKALYLTYKKEYGLDDAGIAKMDPGLMQRLFPTPSTPAGGNTFNWGSALNVIKKIPSNAIQGWKNMGNIGGNIRR